MGRWEPDARQRLVRAAVELFSEAGYESTTVAQIAEQAGLTKSTFFRHFPDKREVLFAGQDILSRLFTDGIAHSPVGATTLEAVAAGLDAATATFTPERREYGPTLRAVIADNSELQEREALKNAGFVAAMAQALRLRGVPDPTAGLGAELGVLAFKDAFARWTDPTNRQEFGVLARRALHDLHVSAQALDTEIALHAAESRPSS